MPKKKPTERRPSEKKPLEGIQISFVSAVSWKVLEARARRQRKAGLPPEQCIQLDAVGDEAFCLELRLYCPSA